MVDLARFSQLKLPGDFVLDQVAETDVAMIDPVGRPALAKTSIVGRTLSIALASGLDAREQSISLYHEILEGLSVGMREPPSSVVEFLERDFEEAAIAAHEKFGFADPEKVIGFLQGLGF